MSATFPELPKLSKILDTIAELGAFNPHDGAGWELRKLRWYRDALFENFAPFKVGDRVVMHTAYPLGRLTGGWAGREEMMQPGARATVVEVDWTARELHDPDDAKPGDGDFGITVRFDREWVVGTLGNERRVYEATGEDRHVFMFARPERWWRREQDA